MPHGMMPPDYMNHHLQHVSSPPKPGKSPPPQQPDAKDEAISRLEKLILDERTDREAREAAREAAIERAASEKAAAEERAAAEKKIAEEAAAHATAVAKAEAKVEAEKFAAEEVAKAQAAADEATAAAVAEAAAEAAETARFKAVEAANQPPPPPKKPIKFKDAVGRKFSFPFHLCNTWQVRFVPLLIWNFFWFGIRQAVDELYFSGNGRIDPSSLPPRRRNRPARRRRPLRPHRTNRGYHPAAGVGERGRARLGGHHAHVAYSGECQRVRPASAPGRSRGGGNGCKEARRRTGRSRCAYP